MRTTSLVSLVAVVGVALSSGACRKKVDVAEVLPTAPEPPPIPEPEPEPVPTCDTSKALKGDWYVSIVVNEDVEGPIKGMNAYYRLSAFPLDEPCQTRFLYTLQGWGRGQLKYEKNYGGETLLAEEPEDGWWHVPLHYGIGEGAEEETEMVMRFRQVGEGLEGYWFYTGPSWQRSAIWGTLQARREVSHTAFSPSPNATMALSQCPLKGMDMATANTCK